MEISTAQDGFWNLPLSERTALLKDISRLTGHIESWKFLDSLHDNLKVAAELYREDNDEELLKEIIETCEELEKKLESLEITSLFNGESDDRNAIVSIHPGAGGTESADWTTMLYDMYR